MKINFNQFQNLKIAKQRSKSKKATLSVLNSQSKKLIEELSYYRETILKILKKKELKNKEKQEQLGVSNIELVIKNIHLFIEIYNLLMKFNNNLANEDKKSEVHLLPCL